MAAGIDLKEIESEVRAGLPRVQAVWKNFGREIAYYQDMGHKMIPSREAESATDKNNRPKLATHIVSRVVGELSKGLYSQPGPSRKITGNDQADALVQSIVGEHRVNRQLQKCDAFSWLNGIAGVQCVPNVDVVHRRHTGESIIKGNCPVAFRLWKADSVTAWCDDQDTSYPIVVCARSYIAGRERLQIWTDTQIKTYMGMRAASSFAPGSQDQFELDPSSSGPNPFGVIPFCWFFNEDPSEGFYTPGIGASLCNTAFWMDQLLSDLSQACDVYCIHEKYSRNLSVSARMMNRPGDMIDLIERDPSKNADVFFSQPKLDVAEIWLHLENVLNEALVGLDIPIRIEVQATSGPESGIALIIRRQPLQDKWRARQDQARVFEHDLWRTAAQVAVISLDDPSLVGANSIEEAVAIIKALPIEVDFPEFSLPAPSIDKDQSDQWELDLGIKSKVQVCMERYGKTREQAIAHIKQVAEDEKAITSPATMQPKTPPLKITGDKKDVYEMDFSSSAANPKAPVTSNLPAATGS